MKIKETLIILTSMIFGVLIGLWIISLIHTSENECKKYIIEHQGEIKNDSSNEWWDSSRTKYFKITSCDWKYFTDITIKKIDDSCYSVVFWGNRDSWWWDIKSDTYFTVDITYNKYKGKNVDKDIKIIEILNRSIKTNKWPDWEEYHKQGHGSNGEIN